MRQAQIAPGQMPAQRAFVKSQTEQCARHQYQHRSSRVGIDSPQYGEHGAFKVLGDTRLKLLTVHIVDKDKPLYDFVK